MLELGIEASSLGPEVRDAKRSGYSGTRQYDDVAGGLEQAHGVVQGVILQELRPLLQLPDMARLRRPR